MRLPFVFRDEAASEFEHAADFYEHQRPGPGEAFVLEVQKALDLVSARPTAYRSVLDDIRKAVVRRFPYCIYYRVRPRDIEIVAIFHTSPDPGQWTTRMP